MRRVGAFCMGLGGLALVASITRYILYLAARGPRDPMATEGETLSYAQFQQVLILIAIGVVLLGLGAYFRSASKIPPSHETQP